jgi:antitoxin (DNA-binding transcriptional repressor) of toxin-antitoxin stability system
MVSVGVEALRDGLPEYLRRVQEGETVLITAEGLVVATLSPPKASIPIPAGHPQAEGLAAGSVRPPALPKAGWTWRPRSLNLPPGTSQELLDELRKDSWEP